jgi:inner membrane protein
LVAAAIGARAAPASVSWRYWVAGISCAVLLDIDAIGRPFGLGDLAFFGGHRALTHSMLFAIILGLSVTYFGFRDRRWDGSSLRIAVYLIMATASHGLLDAFASYGSGVAFFYPLSVRRWSAPWQPIGATSEILWIWIPAALFLAAFACGRSRRLG